MNGYSHSALETDKSSRSPDQIPLPALELDRIRQNHQLPHPPLPLSPLTQIIHPPSIQTTPPINPPIHHQTMPPKVHSVSLSPAHSFSKTPVTSITLVQGHGVSGDSHAGTTVQHLSRQRTNPSAPNLRQVHFISREFLSTLGGGCEGEGVVNPGDLGENVTTSGIDILRLGRGDRLRFVRDEVGEQEEEEEEGTVVVEITGLRNPCPQIEKFRRGLQEKCIVREREGGRIVERKAGVMGIVVLGGRVDVGMRILVGPAEGARVPLEVV